MVQTLYEYCYEKDDTSSNDLEDVVVDELMGDEDIEDMKQSSLIDIQKLSCSSDGCQALSDEENEVDLTRSDHKYCLLTFCETRCYSA
mgnify:CR=1 FL=1